MPIIGLARIRATAEVASGGGVAVAGVHGLCGGDGDRPGLGLVQYVADVSPRGTGGTHGICLFLFAFLAFGTRVHRRVFDIPSRKPQPFS